MPVPAGSATMVTGASRDRVSQAASRIVDGESEAPSTVTAVTGDVSNEDDVRRVVAAGVAGHGGIDVLVNNAGISDLRGLDAENYDTETFKKIIDVDLIGARCLVFLVGSALLLAGRSYRHTAARALLRTGGLGCWAWLAGDLLTTQEGARVAVLAGCAIGLAAILVVVAVATGRGWRSAWWARRAEVAEVLDRTVHATEALLVRARVAFRKLHETGHADA